MIAGLHVHTHRQRPTDTLIEIKRLEVFQLKVPIEGIHSLQQQKLGKLIWPLTYNLDCMDVGL